MTARCPYCLNDITCSKKDIFVGKAAVVGNVYYRIYRVLCHNCLEDVSVAESRRNINLETFNF